jgi:hypothetical protein
MLRQVSLSVPYCRATVDEVILAKGVALSNGSELWYYVPVYDALLTSWNIDIHASALARRG